MWKQWEVISIIAKFILSKQMLTIITGLTNGLGKCHIRVPKAQQS